MNEQSGYIRSFHNNIKRNLIYQIANNGNSLFDIGVGRGGDIFKWSNSGVKNVIGIDIEDCYIDEAMRRFKDSKLKRNYKFYNDSSMLWEKYGKFDNVSCQFALHYFCKDLETLNTFFYQISKIINPGGYFVGTVPDGDKISELLNISAVFQNKAGYIKKEYNEINRIGDRIKYSMIGTLYFGDKTLSSEYLVFKETIEKTANKFNFKLIFWKSFEEFDDINKTNMIPDFKDLSFLNSAFMFKKMD